MAFRPRASILSGQIAFCPGLGVFRGYVGDNKMHRHCAHQLCVGIGQDLRMSVAGGTLTAPALFVPAYAYHQLWPAKVLTIFIDPTIDEARRITAMLADADSVAAAPPELAGMAVRAFGAEALAFDDFRVFRALLQLDALPLRNVQLDAVLDALQASMHAGEKIDRPDLAAVAGLSQSRFSHWFSEQTGVPLRTYRKWLRLVSGVEQVLAGRTLTDAAHAAGFSDQAHFTRTFMQMFGINPSIALSR